MKVLLFSTMFFRSSIDDFLNVSLNECSLRNFDQNGGIFIPKNFSSVNISKIKDLAILSQKDACIEMFKFLFEDFKHVSSVIDYSFGGLSKIAQVNTSSGNVTIVNLFDKIGSYSDFLVKFCTKMYNVCRVGNRKSICIVPTNGPEGISCAKIANENPHILYFVILPFHVSDVHEKFLMHISENLKNVYVVKMKHHTIDDVYILARSLLNSRLLDYTDVFSISCFNFNYTLGCFFQILCAMHEVAFVPSRVSLPCLNLEYMLAGKMASKIGFNLEKPVVGLNFTSILRKMLEHGHMLRAKKEVYNKNHNMLNEIPWGFEFYFDKIISKQVDAKDILNSLIYNGTAFLPNYVTSEMKNDFDFFSMKEEDVVKYSGVMMKKFNQMFDPATVSGFFAYDAFTYGKDVFDNFIMLNFENHQFYSDLIKDVLSFNIDLSPEFLSSKGTSNKPTELNDSSSIFNLIVDALKRM